MVLPLPSENGKFAEAAIPELLARLKNYPRKAGVLYTADTEQA